MEERLEQGARTSVAQWDNGNESRRFPFADDSDMSCENGSSMPDWVLTDAMVVVCRRLSEVRATLDPVDVKVECMHVGPGMVSVCLSCGSLSALCTVASSEFEPYRPFPITDASPAGVDGSLSGFVSFGDTGLLTGPSTWRPSNCILCPSCVVEIPAGRVVEFADDRTGESVSGDVVMSVPAGVMVSFKDEVAEAGSQSIEFSLGDALEQSVVSPCETADTKARAGEIGHLRRINGILPDESGSIAVVFK